MRKTKKIRLGQLPPKYKFVLNPFPEFRASNCIDCNRQNSARKVPLLIHVEPTRFVALNYTCRYCLRCDLLLGHQHEIEHLLHDLFLKVDPQAIGTEYVIIGTIEKAAWRLSRGQPKTPSEMLAQTHDFKAYSTLHLTQGGWFPRDMEPPEMVPPPSAEWVKGNASRQAALLATR